MKAFLTAAAMITLGLPALAQGEAQDQILAVSYRCAGDATLDVVFLNTAAGNGYAVMQSPDGLVPMRIAPSGSGARYEAVASDDGRVLWTKGEDATLYDGPDLSRTVMADCRAVPGKPAP